LPEWLIERGIGETRAALVDGSEIIEAAILRDGIVRAGTVLQARLRKAGRNGLAEAEGREYLLPHGAGKSPEGAMLSIEVVREELGGAEPWKRAIARMSDEQPRPAHPVAGQVLAYPTPVDVLGAAGWLDLVDEARSGMVRFAGGELRITPTPAMTLIDVDGALPADELAFLGASAAAKAIRRLDIGGSIGIDLPTVKGKAARQAAAEAIDAVLPLPFERTAVNGFGFVQIVRPRLRPSLVELFTDGAEAEARAMLRAAATGGRPGAARLVAHLAVIAVLEANPDWLEALSRQIGGSVSLRAEPSLPISGGHAEPA
jgi:hypothetical protein